MDETISIFNLQTLSLYFKVVYKNSSASPNHLTTGSILLQGFSWNSQKDLEVDEIFFFFFCFLILFVSKREAKHPPLKSRLIDVALSGRRPINGGLLYGFVKRFNAHKKSTKKKNYDSLTPRQFRLKHLISSCFTEFI